MANSYTGAFATLPAAIVEAEKAKVANNFLLDAVYRDFKPAIAQPWDTINVNIPASTYSVTNVSATPLSFSDVTATPKSVQLSFHPAIQFAVPDFDQVRSPIEMRELFLDEAVKQHVNYIDAQIGALFTSGNFNVNAIVNGGTAATIVDADMSTLYTELASEDINVRDPENMALAVHPTVYGNQLKLNTWTQSAYVGNPMSGEIRHNAILGRQWGALCDYDRFMPVVSSIYTSCLFHRYAIALVARAMPMTGGLGGVLSTTVYYKGLPLRVTLDYNQTRLGVTVTVDALFGVAVTRPDFGVLHKA